MQLSVFGTDDDGDSQHLYSAIFLLMHSKALARYHWHRFVCSIHQGDALSCHPSLMNRMPAYLRPCKKRELKYICAKASKHQMQTCWIVTAVKSNSHELVQEVTDWYV